MAERGPVGAWEQWNLESEGCLRQHEGAVLILLKKREKRRAGARGQGALQASSARRLQPGQETRGAIGPRAGPTFDLAHMPGRRGLVSTIQ